MSEQAQESLSISEISELRDYLSCLMVLPPGTNEKDIYPLLQTIDSELGLAVSVLSFREEKDWSDIWDQSAFDDAQVVIVDVTDMHPTATYTMGYIDGVGENPPSAVPIAVSGSLEGPPSFPNTLYFEEYQLSEDEKSEFIEAIREALEASIPIRAFRKFRAMEKRRATEDPSPETEDPSLERVPVSIYLPDDVSLLKRERLKTAVGEFMEAMGFEPKQEEEPMLGSWFQRLWFKAKDFFSQDEVQEAYEDGYDALKSYIEGSTAAEQTSELGGAAAELIESLENTPSATIRLGNLILLKRTVTGEPRIHIETVSPSIMRELESGDFFERDPKEVKDFIDERQSATGTREPDESERGAERLQDQKPLSPKTSESTDAETSES